MRRVPPGPTKVSSATKPPTTFFQLSQPLTMSTVQISIDYQGSFLDNDWKWDVDENCTPFNWTGLPTELKSRVIESCMGQSLSRGERTAKGSKRYRGAYEVTDRLGPWSSLLRVSHQVRAITLRLSFLGSSSMVFDKGLCICVSNPGKLHHCVKRLGNHLQMVQSNSMPVNKETASLARTYEHYPKIFPHLKQYATFGHGIQKIHLEMSFLDALHFFKVTVGGFKRFWRPHWLDYGVFDRLPNLNQLIIELPDAQGRLVDEARQYGPTLFYEHPFPCPRILHRFVYEQAAEVLAHHKNVTLYGFIDELEKMRYTALRKAAVEAVKLNSKELGELYEEDGGGIELEESVVPGLGVQKTEETKIAVQYAEGIQEHFWPPKCRCEVLCKTVLSPV
ncbi:hypothetical protein EJ02DRAFT_455336 [Clathrospora elynae]|uniref:Uncharacterized protein n=1 Tax=Clathrospora elynae TaxID=706981 RepID=A0A6A5SNJ4_9PLEO|nr:hypothetical protein EJ02DRAFT_455336 [Clathrospora elynae]